MQQNCERSIKFSLSFEGGYVNHPKDPGGPTNLGITIATLSLYLQRRATVADVRGLRLADAINIYDGKYWTAIGADALPGGVDLLAFDIAVNSGVGRALRWLDETDGLGPRARVEALHKRRIGFWRGLTKLWPVFGKGWTRRETAAHAAALALVGAAAPLAA